MLIGENIAFIRKTKGLSQNKLAKAAGISQSGINDIEAGKKSPRFETLELIANGLEVDISELVSDNKVHELSFMNKQWLYEIQKESVRQNKKRWELKRHPHLWFSIIGKEYGDMCNAFIGYAFDEENDHLEDMQRVATKIAAACVAMLECIDEQINESKAQGQVCRVCGCTDDNACDGGCYWVEKDLCSQCVGII